MIEGKNIKFGYGDVVIGNNSFLKILRIQPLNKDQKVGDIITGSNICEGDEIRIPLSFEEVCKLKSDLKNIENIGFIVPCKDYILDFTNYNQKSVDVMLRHVSDIYYSYQMYMVV